MRRKYKKIRPAFILFSVILLVSHRVQMSNARYWGWTRRLEDAGLAQLTLWNSTAFERTLTPPMVDQLVWSAELFIATPSGAVFVVTLADVFSGTLVLLPDMPSQVILGEKGALVAAARMGALELWLIFQVATVPDELSLDVVHVRVCQGEYRDRREGLLTLPPLDGQRRRRQRFCRVHAVVITPSGGGGV